MKPIYFTPGPSELYFTVSDHMRTALKLGIPSIYHRSEAFKRVMDECTENLRTLFDLPEDYRIVFTSSATEIWERIVLNLVAEKAAFVTNGAFSKRFAEIATAWSKEVDTLALEDGHGYDPLKDSIPEAELIGIAHNETSTGVMTPSQHIHGIRESHPDSILAVDIVSSAPNTGIDFSKIDTAYLSVQKGFGLPAGLGVWMFNQRCLDKAHELERLGKQTGSYHRLIKLAEMADRSQTPSTPNILGIYLLNSVAKDMLTKGLDMIDRETRYKSAVLYHAIENHPELGPFVNNPAYRSRTTIVARVQDSSAWQSQLLKSNFFLGQGYGPHKDTHLRIANFPTHSKEQVELLSDEIAKVRLK